MTRLPWVLLGCLPAGALSLGACGLGGPAYGPASDAAAVVEMRNSLAFQPDTVRIKVGETVEWRNRSVYTHTVTDDDAALPPGAPPFNARVAAGEVYRHIFTVPGIYPYFCMPHESFGMRGRVIVEPAG